MIYPKPNASLKAYLHGRAIDRPIDRKRPDRTV